MKTNKSLPEVARFLPHRPPMLFVTEIVSHDTKSIVCAGIIPEKSPFSRDGKIPTFALLEAAAQATAVHEGLIRSSDTSARPGPSMGYLVGIEDVHLARPELPVKKTIVLEASLDTSLPPLSVYRVTVLCDEEAVLQGSLKTYGSVG